MMEISEWFLGAIDRVQKNNDVVDVHVDTFVDISSLTELDLVKSSIRLFDDFIKLFKREDREGIVIYLSIDLVEHGDFLVGAPKNFEELCREVDKFSVPEIVLYKPMPLIYPTQVELYRKPLFYEEFVEYVELSFFYKEDRPAIASMGNVDFRRELNVMFIP